VCCSVLQCVAVCCSVVQCVAVCCSVLQCVAVCCSVLQCVAGHISVLPFPHEAKQQSHFTTHIVILPHTYEQVCAPHILIHTGLLSPYVSVPHTYHIYTYTPHICIQTCSAIPEEEAHLMVILPHKWTFDQHTYSFYNTYIPPICIALVHLIMSHTWMPHTHHTYYYIPVPPSPNEAAQLMVILPHARNRSIDERNSCTTARSNPPPPAPFAGNTSSSPCSLKKKNYQKKLGKSKGQK